MPSAMPSYSSGWGQHAAASELCEMLSTLGIAQHHVARLFGVGPRSVRRWQRGDRDIPCGVGIVLRLLAVGAVTVSQVERAAVPVPVRTNGNAKPDAPPRRAGAGAFRRGGLSSHRRPHSVDPTSVDPTSLPTPPSPTPPSSTSRPDHLLCQKVVALAPGACRWPYGDPRHPDFHFCGDLVAQRPYCGRHRALAYVAPAARQFSRSGTRSLRQRF